MNKTEALEYHMHHWNLVAEAQKAKPRKEGWKLKRLVAWVLNGPSCGLCIYVKTLKNGNVRLSDVCFSLCPIDWPTISRGCLGGGSPFKKWDDAEFPSWELALAMACLAEKGLDDDEKENRDRCINKLIDHAKSLD